MYKAYLDEGDVSSAFSLFVKMKQGERYERQAKGMGKFSVRMLVGRDNCCGVEKSQDV